MYRIGLALLGGVLLACNGGDGKGKKEEGTTASQATAGFSDQFTALSLPYQLTDSSLQKNEDTTSFAATYLQPFLPDSIPEKIFGKTKGVKYTPLGKIEQKKGDAYYIIKASAGKKKAALLLVVNGKTGSGATTPFLVPDDNTATSQTSTLDKSYAFTKAVTQRDGSTIIGEGKEVLAYDAGSNAYSLVMTDLLSDNPAVLVNPIDTFGKTNPFAGDYYLNKKSLVAVRDGRYPNQILVYIHTENSEGDCRGELKGEFLVTGTSTATYRQGGDPCVLGLTFAGNKVTLNEESGCGNYRGLDCPLAGTFTRKKAEVPKGSVKKEKRSKKQ